MAQPGGTVELVEVSTRRQLVERVTEISVETALHTETSLTQQDELSDAVRQENTSNTKFGVSLNTNNAFSLGSVFTTSIGTGTSFDLDNSEKTSRENLHKSLRQQTEKVSTDLKRSFKSVFRTVTETTDTKSRRYVIQNTTEQLINYELRRKMRQVGVQVQDLGTYLCWQTMWICPASSSASPTWCTSPRPGTWSRSSSRTCRPRRSLTRATC